jgi:hypothetical protein
MQSMRDCTAQVRRKWFSRSLVVTTPSSLAFLSALYAERFGVQPTQAVNRSTNGAAEIGTMMCAVLTNLRNYS